MIPFGKCPGLTRPGPAGRLGWWSPRTTPRPPGPRQLVRTLWRTADRAVECRIVPHMGEPTATPQNTQTLPQGCPVHAPTIRRSLLSPGQPEPRLADQGGVAGRPARGARPSQQMPPPWLTGKRAGSRPSSQLTGRYHLKRVWARDGRDLWSRWQDKQKPALRVGYWRGSKCPRTPPRRGLPHNCPTAGLGRLAPLRAGPAPGHHPCPLTGSPSARSPELLGCSRETVMIWRQRFAGSALKHFANATRVPDSSKGAGKHNCRLNAQTPLPGLPGSLRSADPVLRPLDGSPFQ